MAQDITNATGIETDAAYPSGVKIKDGQTVVNAFINQDIVQFFQKLMKIAAITPNDLDDNETNGYQFYTAMVATIRANVRASEGGYGCTQIATSAQTKGGTFDAGCVTPEKLAIVTSRLIKKKLSLGGWDINTAQEVAISHGLSATEWKTITSISVIIRNDADDVRIDPFSEISSGVPQFVQKYATSSIIFVKLLTGGVFDTSGFQQTSFSRGTIELEYLPD